MVPIRPDKTDPSVSPEQQALLAAAMEAFASFGYYGTTTRHLAAKVGRSPGALYSHYESKHELLFQIIRQGHETLLATVLAAVALGGSPTEQLIRATRAHVEFHVVHRALGRVANYELPNLEPAARAEISHIRHRVEEAIVAIVGAGKEAGEFSVQNPELAAAALLSLGIDLARWHHPGSALSAHEIFDGYATFACDIVRTNSRPTTASRARSTP